MGELSEMEMRILSELIEDWENIPTIANTVTLRAGEDSERLEIKDALRRLIDNDLVLIAAPSVGGAGAEILSKAGSLAVVADLERHLRFDASTGYWDSDTFPYSEISITAAGHKKVDEIRRERPERWWWPAGWR